MKTITFVMATLIYGVFMVWRCSYVGINSDFANLVLEGDDILAGNFFRRNWNLTGVSFLTTDLPYFVIGTLFFGVSNRAYIFACALMDVVLVLAAFLLVRDACKKDRIMSALIMFSFAMTPCHFAIDLLRAHTGVLILGFVLIYLFSVINNKGQVVEKRTRIVIDVLYIVVLAIAFVGDPIILIIAFTPICLWTMISWLGKRIETEKMLRHIGINMMGAMLGILLDKLYFYVGGANKNGFLESKSFISFDQLEDKFALYLKSIFYMADAHFENQQLISINSVFYAVNSIAIVLFFVLIIQNIVFFIIDKKYDFITVILGMGFLVLSVLFIGTSISVDINSARYMSYFPVLMAVVFIRNISLIQNCDRWYFAIGVILVVALAGKVCTTVNDSKSIPMEQIKLAEYLEDNDLTNGYSSFWNASSVTVLSNERVTVRSIEAYGDCFRMHNWFCRSDWYSEPAWFIVTEDADSFGVTRENILKSIGEPYRIIKCENYDVMIYNYDISNRIL